MRVYELPSGTLLDLDRLSLVEPPYLGARTCIMNTDRCYHDAVCNIQIDGSDWMLILMKGIEYFEPGRAHAGDPIYEAEKQAMLDRGKLIHDRLIRAWMGLPDVVQREERLINV